MSCAIEDNAFQLSVKILLEATDTLYASEYNITKISVMNCMFKQDAH